MTLIFYVIFKYAQVIWSKRGTFSAIRKQNLGVGTGPKEQLILVIGRQTAQTKKSYLPRGII